MYHKVDVDTMLLNKKENSYSSWYNTARPDDDRWAANRLRQPFAKILAHPTFSFDESQAIFTMGSCFARRLEDAMYKKKIHVPMFEGMIANRAMFPNSVSFNKYNTFSMLYELQWALDEHSFHPSNSIIQLGDDRFCDLQSVSADFNNAPFKDIMNRKNKVFELTRKVLESQVIVLTLGLNEVWYDHDTGHYLNMTPDLRFLTKYPNRFELRILGLEENILNLNKIYDLLSKKHDQLNMIVTVSPVPLLATFTNHDIVVANSLSKSTLVATAHEFVAQHANVNYFPSYEIAMLSDKSRMWEDDLRHISADGASFIIDTFLTQYLEKTSKDN